MIGDTERPQCVLCNKVLGADSMRPNKMKTHLSNVHPALAGKDTAYFQRMERSVKASRLDTSGKVYTENEAAVTASYEVSRLIAQTKNPHTIGEKLILPAIQIAVKRLFGEKEAKKSIHFHFQITPCRDECQT